MVESGDSDRDSDRIVIDTVKNTDKDESLHNRARGRDKEGGRRRSGRVREKQAPHTLDVGNSLSYEAMLSSFCGGILPKSVAPGNQKSMKFL